jgi:RNA polymerase sigma-70 factor, ECF subfamily
VADTTVSFPIDTAVEHSTPAEPLWLVEGLRNGDESAFEALVTRYQQPVYNLVYRLMDDPSDACDVVQEVFLKVFRNAASFRGSSSLKTWIYRIAVNEAYNHRRWFHRHRRREVGLEAEEENSRSYQDILSDPGRSPFELAAGTETRALVEQALTEINEVFRPAIILRDMEDMSYEEVAEVLQVSIGTVKSRILRGREALRKTLTGRLEREHSVRFKAQVVE